MHFRSKGGQALSCCSIGWDCDFRYLLTLFAIVAGARGFSRNFHDLDGSLIRRGWHVLP